MVLTMPHVFILIRHSVYLAGFALTLVFVIARLIELMHENVNGEEENEGLAKQLKEVVDKVTQTKTTALNQSSSTSTTSTLRQRQTNTNADKKD